MSSFRKKICYYLGSVALGTILFAAAPIVINSQALAIFPQNRSQSSISDKAKRLTVLIDCRSPGSGIIYDRNGNTYRVLTAWHVVQYGDDWCHTIQTPDGQRHPFNQRSVQQIAGLDVAILEFQSSYSYPTARAEFGNSDQVRESSRVYVAGYPEPSPGVPTFYSFTVGEVVGRLSRPLEGGYSLLYTNATRAGVSGGPVLDRAGKIIGIHGQSENLGPDQVAYRIGIPANSFLGQIPPFGATLSSRPIPGPISRSQPGHTPRFPSEPDPRLSCPTDVPRGIYRPLSGGQSINDVTIAFYCALLNRSGTYIAQFYIRNNADRTFLSMPVNAKVLDANGDRVTARVNVDRIGVSSQTARGMIVEPGATLKMMVTIVDRGWVENRPQGLVLQIQEDSRGRRLFQVPF